MSRSGHFSVTAAVALVLGGIAALALAIAIAWGRSGRLARIKASASRAPAASSAVPWSNAAASASPSTTSAEHEVDVEYPLDTSDP